MTTTLRRTLACLAIAPLLALAGCGGDDATPREGTVTSEPTNSSSASASTTPTGPVTPEDALALGGLQLPSNANDATAERVDVAAMQWLEAYRVTFTAPRSNALQICQQAGLTGDVPSSGLTNADRELLGPAVEHVKGMRKCAGLWPDDTAWQRLAVVLPGDPTTVHVAVARMGR
ncbi:hypothetical protein [Knoellia subterranea]|nr:hypothetical protein [Knoellia subterranea]